MTPTDAQLFIQKVNQLFEIKISISDNIAWFGEPRANDVEAKLQIENEIEQLLTKST